MNPLNIYQIDEFPWLELAQKQVSLQLKQYRKIRPKALNMDDGRSTYPTWG